LNASVINPAVEFTSSAGLGMDHNVFTLGYEFTTSAPLIVNALGYWVDGQAINHQVGIWNSVGTLLTSATILGSDPIQGHFQWHAISDYTLLSGTYRIGGEYVGVNPNYPTFVTGLITISDYTWVTDRQFVGAGLNYPTQAGGGYGNNGILLANFSVYAVPEPSTYLAGLSAFGMLGLFGWRNRK
jgi:hypothetical protein